MRVSITYNGRLSDIADMLENNMQSIVLSAAEQVKNSAQSHFLFPKSALLHLNIRY